MKRMISLLLLAVVHLIHCQEDKQMVDLTLQGVMEKLESISDKLKGYEAIQQKQHEIMETLRDMQQKLGILDTKYQELSRETTNCLHVDNLEQLTNVSEAGGHQEIKSIVEEEILSRLISLSETDECSEGSHNCGSSTICKNTLFSFTCSCSPGFIWDGSECTDIDECVQGQADCSSHASCRNTIGNYSCSCNPTFKGDGRTCSCPSGTELNGDTCEDCSGKGKFLSGLGCVKIVTKYRTFQEMSDFCQEKGGRLLQDFEDQHMEAIRTSSRSFAGWVGVYDEKWMGDQSPVPQNLWSTGYRTDPSRRCGFLEFDHSVYAPKLTQWDCSVKTWGYCQFQMP